MAKQPILEQINPAVELEKINRVLATKFYADYCSYVHEGRWIAGKHLLYICDKIDKFLEDKLINDDGKVINGLIIQMPPQHGKSHTVTETLPSYYNGRWPDKRVIEISYGDELAQVFGRRNKEKIEKFGELIFGIKLKKGTRSETEFELEGHIGGMISRGLGGSITGRPGDIIIIDDPIKNRQEADSETYRNRLWDEWLNTIKTRHSANGKTILIQTRWHEDDLAGRLQRTEKEKWFVISLPCEAEEDDPIGRQPGDALFPEIGKDKAWLQEYKKSYITQEGSRAWNALFQQRPTSAEGNVIKREWWRYYTEDPIKLAEKMEDIVQSWDMTFKDGAKNDFVVGQVWGRWKANKYLLDQVRARMDFPTTVQAVRNLSAKWPRAYTKFVEDKANGSAVIATLQRDLGGCVAIKPEGGKESRVAAASPAIEAGNVYIPDPAIAPWINDFMDECAAFPSGTHDDQVDAMSQALIRLNQYIHHEPGETMLDIIAQHHGKDSAEYQIYRELFANCGEREISIGEII